MIVCDDEKIIVQGAVTLDNVVTITQQGMALLDGRHNTVDLMEVVEVDSTTISMLLEWLRIARQKGYQLQFVNLPGNLESLIQLYGIAELIPVTTNDSTAQGTA
jgi:phospholipid transport system transporter-binding protein